MKHTLQCLAEKKDISRRAFWVMALLLVLLKLLLTSRQYLYLEPQGAPLDDTLLYDMAVSIAGGHWLGEYNWLTLSKYMLFPVWLAGLHMLGIPYLLGGQMLYTVACAVGAAALAPVLQRKLTQLALFAALLFSPAAWAAVVQLRVYRDNITPALALLVFGGFAGAALRYQRGARCTVAFLLAAGFGLTGCCLNREDGVWYLVFAAAATIITCVFLLLDKKVVHKAGKCLLHMVPYAMLCMGVLAFCMLNQKYYGRFIVSDFTTREFKDACGALMRVSAAEPVERVPVSYAARQKIYKQVPEFAALEPVLESPDFMNGYADVETHEYGAGSFYWALRRAVWEAGFADTAQQAQHYYEVLAQKINALCDMGTLPAFPTKRHISSTIIPVAAKDVPATLYGMIEYMGRMLIYDEAAPAYTHISICPPDLQQEYETFLRGRANLAAKPYTAEAAYSSADMIAFGVLDVAHWGYALAIPVLFSAAVMWLVWGACDGIRSRRARQQWPFLLVWLLELGLLLAVLLRCCMISYLFVTSFNPWVGKLLYLSGAHAALLLFSVVGGVMLTKRVRMQHLQKKKKI